MDIKSFDSLFARLDDFRECAVRGNVGISAFFSPREEFAAIEYLKHRKVSFISFGGYSNAERKRIYVLPDFIEYAENIEAIYDFGFSCEIDCFRIDGSGFEAFSHRAVMGAILGLGIERDSIGDIVMIDDKSAIFFCDTKLRSFFEENFNRVGRDKVKIRRIDFDESIIPERKVQRINDTVSSPRLDCVVSAICSLSRERAKEKIAASLVELNYECVEKPDKILDIPSVISVRGFGKFRIISLSEMTRKGRYRLVAEKFL